MCAFLLACQYVVYTEMSGYGLRWFKVTSLSGAFTVNCFRINRFHGGRPTTAAAAADGDIPFYVFYAPCNVVISRLVRKVDFCCQCGGTNFRHL
jgi:hypothetical protein